MARWKKCRGCDDDSLGVIPLCPSCRYVGKVFFALGAVVAGAAMKVFGL